MKNFRNWIVLLTCTLFILSGCASVSHDPFEPINRAFFHFNDTIDQTIAQPVAKGYQWITPKPLQTAINNFFSNIGDFNNFGNNLLQLHIAAAAEDLMRITINTVFGICGLIDFASLTGLPKHNQSFGATLGAWGIPEGPFLVLPLFGPTTVRDGLGLGVDLNITMLNYLKPSTRNPLFGLQFVSARAQLLNATDILNVASLDPYSFMRDAYLAQQRKLIHPVWWRNKANNQNLPNYNDPQTPTSTNSSSEATLPSYVDPGETNPAH